LVLKIFRQALDLEDAFLSASRATSTSSVLLTSLRQLLMGVNPRSGQPDHMLNAAKFVTYAWWMPAAALNAVHVLAQVSAAPGAQPALLSALSPSEAVGQTIIKGFTDVLDSDDEDDEQRDMRLAVLNLLLDGLSKPAPSLAHYLLGFDVKTSSAQLANSTLQPPGVSGAIRTPFHAILSFLRPLPAAQPSPAVLRAPAAAEAAYRVIYVLAANPQTSGPTLRYLRSSEDFLPAQLATLPFPAGDHQLRKGLPWLLKTAAVELKVVAAARMRSQASLLMRLLLDVNPGSSEEDDGQMIFQLSRSLASVRGGEARVQHRLLQLLDDIDFTEESAKMPAWEVFDAAQVAEVLKSCEKAGQHGERVLDVQRLHNILTCELNRVHASAAFNQRQAIQDEIKR